MKHLATAFVLLLLSFSITAQAKPTSKQAALNQLIESLEDAYLSKTLGQLDARRPYRAGVKMVVQHSLGEGADEFEIKNVRTLEEAERWLRSREREDGTPFRETRPLPLCRKGTCTYDFNGGILHNHLYLKRVIYGYRNGRPYLKTILLLDGD